MIRVDLISDVICPWCYVGFRGFLAACARRPDRPVALAFRPYQLDPDVPREGVDRRARLLAKFGGDRERLAAVSEALVKAGHAVGIDFNLDRIEKTPNTMDCHRLLRWARSAHDEAELMCAEALFQAYHVEGEDLTDRGMLVSIARGVGMDGAMVADLLASDADVAAVRAEISIAGDMGVNAVPCFILNQSMAIMGAQDIDHYIRAMDTCEAKTLN